MYLSHLSDEIYVRYQSLFVCKHFLVSLTLFPTAEAHLER